jgi:hypothetical protein
VAYSRFGCRRFVSVLMFQINDKVVFKRQYEGLVFQVCSVEVEVYEEVTVQQRREATLTTFGITEVGRRSKASQVSYVREDQIEAYKPLVSRRDQLVKDAAVGLLNLRD